MLLQLMVYAKIIYLLMVVISGALCTVEDYVIMSQCAHNKAINLAAEGTVSVTDISQTQNITIVGRPDFVNNNFKIALYAKETQRYLCFNDHWKLVGMKELQDTCYFNEAIVHGYFVFRSVVDLQRRIGFTQRGRAVGPKKTVNDACYMFTKIPTDQFFHQHNTHFSAPKMKSTTTKIPKTEYTHAPYSTHVGRGSGGGRKKTNRFKTQQQHVDSFTHNHSGNGHGSGSGSGSGSGNGNVNFNGNGSGSGSGTGNGNRKLRKQRKGNKQRQQKQKQEMQQQVRGHSYKLINPKNSTYLNSSKQNLILSHHSINNHTNKKQNNSNNNHPPQSHQVRHHHNDPNKIARRQQHDQKQKTKIYQRVLPSPSSFNVAMVTAKITTTTTTKAAAATTSTTTTTTATMPPLTTAKVINSTKPHYTLTSSYSQINPTHVIPIISTDATSNSRDVMTSTVVVTKRKGRRRNKDKLYKIGLQKQMMPMHEQFGEQAEEDHSYKSSVRPAYEEEEEYMTSPTDYAWMTNDIAFSSVKPTSASLPSWDTWYSSSSISYTDDNSEHFSVSSASSATETSSDRRLSTTLDSSPMTDFNENTLSSQASIPLRTATITTTLAKNGIDKNISPTITTDLGTTTTNTSTNTQTDFWSNNPNDKTGLNMATIGFTREIFNTYATPRLESAQDILNTEDAFLGETNSLDTLRDLENSTSDLAITNIEDVENVGFRFSSSSTDPTADDTTKTSDYTPIMTSIRDSNPTDDAPTISTITFTNECNSNGSRSMTDCRLSIKNTATIANNHKQKSNEISPKQHSTRNHELSKMERANKETANPLFNIIPIRYENNTSLSETAPTSSHSRTSSLSQPSENLTPTTSLQYLSPIEQSVTPPSIGEITGIHISTATATAFGTTMLSTKSSVPSPLTTRKTLRKSTQKLLATPFHQLTYVRNKAGDIDIDSIDNISIYPDLLDNDNDNGNDNDNDGLLTKPSISRLTMISGYLPTSATATLPESIRIAKIKINRERKRMLRLRNFRNYA